MRNYRDVFVVSYDASGRFLWSIHEAGAGDAAGRAIAAGRCGETVIGGFFSRSIDLEGHHLESSGPDEPSSPFVWSSPPR
jgi:hypothetical protein